jgi:hypothetical protein
MHTLHANTICSLASADVLAVFLQEAAQRSEEARLAQLERLKATVEKLASRGDGRGLTDKYEFSLENQVSM